MKKILGFVLAAGMLLTCSGCTLIEDKIKEEKSKKIIADINENCNFDLPLLTDLQDFDKTSFAPIYGWMGAEEYYPVRYGDENSEVIARYLFSGYPDAVNDWVLTDVSFSDPAIHVYGLTVDSSLESCREKMTEKGFERVDGNDYFEKYQKESVGFSFHLAAGDVTGITVFLESTNRHKIMY